MNGIINIGLRSLQANQSALQVIGNNIANVNTPNYSRQSAVLSSAGTQFSGSGFYGKGVDVVAVQRHHSEYLTQQAALSASVSAGDTRRLEQLKQLEDIFQGGAAGLGSAINDMMNAFSDAASAPTDLAARSVVLTRIDETSARFRAATSRMDDLQRGVMAELNDATRTVNRLAVQNGKINTDIARAVGTGQEPNDLLDQRDRMIAELSDLVQTRVIGASDGTVSVFIAGSQPLVLGGQIHEFGLARDLYGDPAKIKLTMDVNGAITPIEEATLGGGKIAGLLRFQNSDLADAGNLLGRLALAIGTVVNDQHHLGLDLDGNAGGDLIQLPPIPGGLPASGNTGTASLQVAVQTAPSSGASLLTTSNYQVSFTGATAGNIIRLSDGQVTAFTGLPASVDGLQISLGGGTAAAGDNFLLTPFSQAAKSIQTAFAAPRALALSNPISALAASTNTGTLVVDGLTTRSLPAPAAVTLSFTSATTYTRSDTGATVYTYAAGQAIEYDTTPPATTGWALTLKGSPKAADTVLVGANAVVQPNADPRLNGGNARSLLNLRDATLFDGSVLSDGYAGVLSQVGVMVQGATTAADVSSAIAANVEQDRSAVSGVNLDEEAARMLQYQQAYQASAKMLQMAQGMFDALMQNLVR
ncbi:MAG: flagellar hook-associated protein FlgK [Rhodoferax sp.]|nr:flagellar hook-associated protein FlgK [Rhodoferax sp.]